MSVLCLPLYLAVRLTRTAVSSSAVPERGACSLWLCCCGVPWISHTRPP